MNTPSRWSFAKNNFSLAVVVKDAVKGNYLHEMFSARSLEELMLKVYTFAVASPFELERLSLFQAEGRLRIQQKTEGVTKTVDYSPLFVL